MPNKEPQGKMWSVKDQPNPDTFDTWVSYFSQCYESYTNEFGVAPRYVQYASNAPSGFANLLVHDLGMNLAKIKCAPWTFWMSAESDGESFDMRWFRNRSNTDQPEQPEEPEPADELETMFTYDQHTGKLHIHVYEDHPKLAPGHYFIEKLDESDAALLDDLTDEEAEELQTRLFEEYRD
jgi:hypothetical protein